MKKAALLVVKAGLTGFCLWWALKGTDWRGSVFSDPSHLAWQWVLPGLLFAAGAVVLTGLRLKILLAAQGVGIGLWQVTRLTMIGNLFSLVSVGGLGSDAARLYLLMKNHPDRKFAVTTTIVFDHLVGMVAMALAFFSLTAGRFHLLASQSPETKMLLRFGWIFFTGGLILLGLMFVLSCPPVNRKIHGNGREWRIELLRRVPHVCDGFRKCWRHCLLALLTSTAMLPVYYATFWCGARVAGATTEAAPFLTAMPVADALSALPVSVAGLGVREASLTVLLDDLSGIGPDVVVAGSLFGFLFSVLLALPGAWLFLGGSRACEVGGGESGGAAGVWLPATGASAGEHE